MYDYDDGNSFHSPFHSNSHPKSNQIFAAPVVGNFTEEDVNGISPQDSNSLEYPLQRDEVQSTKNNLGDKNFPMQSPKPVDPESETSVVGLIIAILTSIILVLVFAIMFIVARQRRTRTAAVLDALQHNLNSDGLSLGLDKRFNSNFKVGPQLFY